MKTLLMMRHAKSSWDSGVESDHQRPLNDRGRRDAPVMASFLLQSGEVPEAIISSDAVRTCQTLELMLSVFRDAEIHPHVDIDSSFYHAPANEWLEKLPEVSDEFSSVMFLGHNPGAEEFLIHFTGEHHLMPTAAIACFKFDTDRWCDAESGTLQGVWRPKEIQL